MLIPLLESMGYGSVDYNGGPHELGKDVICWKTDELNELHLTVVQVKRYKPSARAGDKQGFQSLVSQLGQAAEESVPHISGTEYKPNTVYFVTPFRVKTRALASRFKKYRELSDSNIRVIDGDKLCDLISQHTPDIITQYLGLSYHIADITKQQLDNRFLMKALHEPEGRDVREFYTDIDVSVGRVTTRLFLGAAFQPSYVTSSVPGSLWNTLCHVRECIRERIEVDIFTSSPECIEKEYQQQVADFKNQAQAVKNTELAIKEAGTDIANVSVAIGEQLEQTRAATQREILQRRSDSAEAEREKSLVQLIADRRTILSRIALGELEEPGDWDLTSEQKKSRLKGFRKRCMSLNMEIENILLDQRNYKRQLASYLRASCRNVPQQFSQMHSGAHLRVAQLSPIITDLEKISETVSWILSRQRARDIDASQWKRTRYEEVDIRESLADLRSHAWEPTEELFELWPPAERSPELIVSRIETLAEKMFGLVERLDKLTGTRSKPIRTVTIDGATLAAALDDIRTSIRKRIERYNQKTPTTKTLSKFLVYCESAFFGADLAIRWPDVRKSLGIHAGVEYSIDLTPYRLSIPVHSIFETGMSFALLGEAGAGKTTTLQMFTGRKFEEAPQELTLYIPLAQMARVWIRHYGGKSSKQRLRIEDAVCLFLRDCGVEVAFSDLASAFNNGRSTLLLDGVDEAIDMAPSLLTEVREFSARSPRVQVVISARMSGNYIESLPYLPITLCRFNDQQRNKFFSAWFAGSPEIVKRIKAHLRTHHELARIVCNPLLATVFCTLAARGVPLPDSEIRLYEERLRLLLGYYDTAKGIDRVHSSLHDLEAVAQHLAFELHLVEKREAAQDWLAEMAKKVVNNSNSTAKQVVEELIHPCNVLVPMTDDGRVGFGHLRYQEFLVARELATNRTRDLLPYTGVDWWRGVFVLFGQIVKDFEWFIALVAEENRVEKCRDLIMDMIGALAEERQESYRELLRRALIVETQDPTLQFGDDVDDDDSSIGATELVLDEHEFASFLADLRVELGVDDDDEFGDEDDNGEY